jgi:hypothetical protein
MPALPELTKSVRGRPALIPAEMGCAKMQADPSSNNSTGRMLLRTDVWRGGLHPRRALVSLVGWQAT